MIKLVTIDESDPWGITLDQIKTQLYLTGNQDDSHLTLLSKVAREYSEGRSWKQIIPSTFTLYLDDFPSGGLIEINKPPIISIESVEYYDSDDNIQTVATADYQVDIEGNTARISPDDSWPGVKDKLNAVEITFKAGFDATNVRLTVPGSFQQAMLLMIKHWYDNRDAILVSEVRKVDSQEVPMTANALLDQESGRIYA